MRRETIENRHVIAKHSEIYPTEDELNAVQKIVSNSEKALKLVSDYLSDLDAARETKTRQKDASADKKDG